MAQAHSNVAGFDGDMRVAEGMALASSRTSRSIQKPTSPDG